MNRIKLGQFGGAAGSFFGDVHRRGARISNKYELIGGVFSSDFEKTKEISKTEGLDLNRCYKDVNEFIEGEMSLPKDDRIEAVSIVTPNYLHFEMAKACLENGIHLICEKPMTMTIEEAEILEKLVIDNKLTFALVHTYTGYPMVRHMREMIKNGEIGEIQRIDAQYYQGWMNPIIHSGNLDVTWRLNPDVAGVSSCMGDIGVHAFNLIEYTTGLKVEKVLSDLNNISPNVKIDVDGSVLLRFNAECKGVIRSSQVAIGEENNLSIKIYGSKLGLKWSQEKPNYLYILSDDEPLKELKPGHPYLKELAAKGHTMPPGHPEGIYEALANIFDGAAKSIRGEDFDLGEFPTVHDGVRGMKFIHKVVESNSNGNTWISL